MTRKRATNNATKTNETSKKTRFAPPEQYPPANAFPLTLSEVMQQSPPRPLRYQNGWATRSKTRSDCKSSGMRSSRSPSPVYDNYSGRDIIAATQNASARKRTRALATALPPIARRSVTPASAGRRSETPLSASHRIPRTSVAASPEPLPPLPPRLPAARVLFGAPPTAQETADFFTQVESQLRDEFGGQWRLGTPSADINPPSVLSDVGYLRGSEV